MKDDITLEEAQADALDRISAQLAEHFEHFVVTVVPGGGGEPLGQPEWTWGGNTCLLTGLIEMAKADITRVDGPRSRQRQR